MQKWENFTFANFVWQPHTKAAEVKTKGLYQSLIYTHVQQSARDTDLFLIPRRQCVKGLNVASRPLGVIWAMEDETWGQH